MAATTTYLITGANRGIGLGLVGAYLQRPHTTVVAAVRDTNSKSSISLEALPKASDSKVIVVKIDSSSNTDADEAISTLKRDHGITSFDVVIANAGIANIYPAVHEAQAKDMIDHYTVNVVGVITLFRATRPLLREGASQGKPVKFVSISSVAGSMALQEAIPIPNAAYGPSKAALNWISKKIAMENKEICAIALQPGFVQTDMGNAGAEYFGMGKADITVDESVAGVVNVIDTATLEKMTGRFLDQTNTEMPW